MVNALNNPKIHKFWENLWVCTSFSLPFFKFLPPVFIAILFVVGLIGLYTSKQKTPLNKLYVLFLLLFYGLHIIGLFYSEDKGFALFDLEVKFSFLILPFCLIFTPWALSEKGVKKTLKAFLISCFVCCVTLMMLALLRWNAHQDDSYFFYEKLSLFHHPGYFALYLNFAIIIASVNVLIEKKDRLLSYVSLLIFIPVLFLLSSRNSLIFLTLFGLFFLLYTSIKGYISWKKMSLIGMALVVFFGILSQTPKIKYRIDASYRSWTGKTEEKTPLRFILWNSASKVFKRNPIFGVGTGDIKNELVKQYKIDGCENCATNKLNAHNQFIQTAACLGLVGFFSLLIMLLYPLYSEIKNAHMVGAGFFTLVIISCLTESILETQSGVIFTAFFYIVLTQCSNHLIKT